MTAARTLTGFAVALTALFGLGALLGGLTGATAPGGDAARAEGGVRHGADAMAGDEPMAGGHAGMAEVHGLAVADNGLRLVVDTPELQRRRTAQLRLRIVDTRGATVRRFDTEHTKRLHLIVVRRDLTGFQHLHPVQGRDGAWSTPLTLPDAGSYRVFADFSHDGEKTTLAADLRVDGSADLRALPSTAATATTADGYTVSVAGGAPRPGAEGELRFTVQRDGRTVHTEPYLGAGGHLVALREGDLAYLHVHPKETSPAAGPAVAFETTFPTAGRYRLFLQFKHDGRVHTAAFTREVAS